MTFEIIKQHVTDNMPISEDELKYLLESADLYQLAELAMLVRLQKNNRDVYYGINATINYTNICELRCPICAFSRDRGESGGVVLSVDEIVSEADGFLASGINELHLVGGLNPDLKADYFIELVTALRSLDSNLHIVALTATEYDYYSRNSALTSREFLELMHNAGVNALPGGGAEIFAENTRKIITPKKISGDRWLDVMREAHETGLKSNATMLYNHLESSDDIVDHLKRLRDLQNITSGFKALVLLPYHDSNTEIERKHSSSLDYHLRVVAASRIYLNNFQHIKTHWMYYGLKEVQVMPAFGADDIGSTFYNEQIIHAAGSDTENNILPEQLAELIERANFVPVLANASYEHAKKSENKK